MSQACKVSKFVPLTETVSDYLTNNEIIENETSSSHTIGGVLTNTKYTWYANGPRFEVIYSSTGVKIAAWTFGSVLRDTTTKVICVAEIPSSDKDLPLLAIGLECVLTGGSFCVFDLVTSKVLRAVQLENKVTSIHVIDSGIEIFPLLGPLRSFDGVLAVGCAGGDVLLIDLCRQSIDDARLVGSVHEIKDEVNACQVVTLTFKDLDIIEYHKQRTVQYGSHLAIHVNAVLNSNSPHFVLKGPKGDDRIHVSKSEVAVSATYYCPQLGSLIIGYNFGALQIWNLINMTLIYTSPVYEENVPISHFAVQEPTDDPRAYCYLWAVYSNVEPNHIGYPVAVLYSLNYETKEWHEGYGYLYQDLQSCTVRFQTTLTSPRDKVQTPQGACCLRLSAFNKGYSSRSSMPESHEDTLTLCSIVWNVWFVNRTVKTYLSVFDLNQWYKEQMPSSPNPTNYQRYMYYVCLSEVMDFSLDKKFTLLDTHINDKSIRQFIGVQKPEEHYYPSALSFECCVCSDNAIAFVFNQGHQRALITSLDSSGSLVLLRPKDVYERAISLGLTPLFSEIKHNPNIHFQREFILNVVLEQQMVGWLCNCVSSWSNGSYTSVGCSLDVFLTWSWNRASVLKANADELCIPLFDYSYEKLDTNVKRTLNNTIKQLTDLNMIYEYMCKKLENFLPNPDVVVEQRNSLQMVSLHLEVLQWMLNVGLLPENHVSVYTKNVQLESISAPYPVDCLVEYYNQRRVALHDLSNEKTSLLFIDNLIDIECGGAVLQKQWESDGGNGLYPPPSLQALLRTYLVDEAALTYKHCVIIYVFLDLAMVLDHEKYKFVVTHLIKFPAVFRLSPSIIKITQAFWQLDHGDFEIAMEQLLDPLISPEDLKPWHHRIILNALLMQKQHNFALLYLQVRRPSLSEVEDIYKVINLLVANEMLDEAFYFQRNNSTKKNEMDLLDKIFDECNKTGQLRKLISYGLNAKGEEEALLNYLKRVNHPEFEEFQVIFYLQRSRYMEIFELQKQKLGQSGLLGQKNVNFPEAMARTLKSFFPKVTRNIINVCHQEKTNLWRQVTKPKPMSVFIHNMEEQAKYKSTLIHASVAKARETWSKPVEGGKLVSEEIPFLRTPTIKSSPSRKRLQVICPKIITCDSMDLDESKPSPSKKMRLSARQSIDAKQSTAPNTSTLCSSSFTNISKLDTPVIKRRTSTNKDSMKLDEKYKICTPQSILKVRNLMTHSSQTSSVDSASKTDLEDEFKMNLSNISTSSKGFCVTPRKSLSRPSSVRFEKPNNTTLDSTPSSNQSKKLQDPSLISLPSSNSKENDKRRSSDQTTSKNSSQSTEVYYSPDSSLSAGDLKDLAKQNIVVGDANISSDNVECIRTDEPDISKDQSAKSKQSDSSSPGMITRLKERELHQNIFKNDSSSEKRSIGRKHSVLSSPDQTQMRLRKRESSQKNSESDDSEKGSSSSEIQVSKQLDSLPSADSLPIRSSHGNSPIGRVSRRKSLSRRVLEHNAFSSILTSKTIKTETWKSINRKINEGTTVSAIGTTSETTCTNEPENSVNLSSFESTLTTTTTTSTLGLPQNSSLSSDSEAVGDAMGKKEVSLSVLQCPPEKVTGRKSVHSMRSRTLFKLHDSNKVPETIQDDLSIKAGESSNREQQIVLRENLDESSCNSEDPDEINVEDRKSSVNPSNETINSTYKSSFIRDDDSEAEDLISKHLIESAKYSLAHLQNSSFLQYFSSVENEGNTSDVNENTDKIERNKRKSVKGRKSVRRSSLLSKQHNDDFNESSKKSTEILRTTVVDDEASKPEAVVQQVDTNLKGVISTGETTSDFVCDERNNSANSCNEPVASTNKSDSEGESLFSKYLVESAKCSLAHLENSSFLELFSGDENESNTSHMNENMDEIERNKKKSVKGRKSVRSSTVISKQRNDDLEESTKVSATETTGTTVVDDERSKPETIVQHVDANSKGVVITEEVVSDFMCVEHNDSANSCNEPISINESNKSIFILDSEAKDLISKSSKYSLAYLQNSSFLECFSSDETEGNMASINENMERKENDTEVTVDMCAIPYESGDVLSSEVFAISDTVSGAPVNTYQPIGPDIFEESTTELEINEGHSLKENESVEVIEIVGSTDESNEEDSFNKDSLSDHSQYEGIESDKAHSSRIEISSDNETSSDYDDTDIEMQDNTSEENGEVLNEETADNVFVEDVAEYVQAPALDANVEVLINEDQCYLPIEHINQEFDGQNEPVLPTQDDANIQLPVLENNVNDLHEKIESDVKSSEDDENKLCQAFEPSNNNSADEELPDNSLTDVEQKIESPTNDITIIKETEETNNPNLITEQVLETVTPDATESQTRIEPTVGFSATITTDTGNECDLQPTEIKGKTTILKVKNVDDETDNTSGTPSTSTTPVFTSGRMSLRKRALSTNSSQVLTNTPPRTLRKRSASVDQHSETKLKVSPKEKPATPSKTNSKNAKLKNVALDFDSPRKRSLRSSSTDLKLTKEDTNEVTKPKNRKASSISSFPVNAKQDEQEMKQVLPKTRSHRSLSITSLPVIEEGVIVTGFGDTRQTRSKKGKSVSSLSDTLEDYSSSRRLTRHQKIVLEKGIIDSAKTKVIKSKRLSGEGVEELEEIDPIKLLDQPAFEGKKDTEEQKILDSPPSSVSDTSPSDRVRSRRMSHDSTSSIVSLQSFSEMGSPMRTRTKSERKLFDSPSTSGMNLRRRRSVSVEDSAGSEHSTTPKKSRHVKQKADDNGESPISIRKSTRNRSKTPDISDVESNSSRKSRRKLASVSKADLIVIPEEKTEDQQEERPVTKGRTRKTSGT